MKLIKNNTDREWGDGREAETPEALGRKDRERPTGREGGRGEWGGLHGGSKIENATEEGEADRRENEGQGSSEERAQERARWGESSDEQEGGRVGRAAGRGSRPGLAGGAPTDPCRRLLPSQAALSSPTASVSQR